MADVERLLSEYIAEHRNGGAADPIEYLDQTDSELERSELVELVDAYLARSPGREWDPVAFQGSGAQRAAEAMSRSITGASGWWPVVLPRLRDRIQLTRTQVVTRLAEALAAPGSEAKVGDYYHEMEHGTLDSRGVSDEVLERLEEIYGQTKDTLRKMGEPLGPGSVPPPAAAMARVASTEYDQAPSTMAEPVAPADRDRIDELFTGGP